MKLYVINFGGYLYEAYENVYDVGIIVGEFLRNYEPEIDCEKAKEMIHKVKLGFEIEKYFEDQNYVSFYKSESVVEPKYDELCKMNTEEIYRNFLKGEEIPEELNEEEWNDFIKGVCDSFKSEESKDKTEKSKSTGIKKKEAVDENNNFYIKKIEEYPGYNFILTTLGKEMLQKPFIAA